MNLIGKLIKNEVNPGVNKRYLTFEISNYRHISLLNKMQLNKAYSLQVNDIKNKRSIEQNKYLWMLMREIDLAMNDRNTDEDDIYLMCLERANIESINLMSPFDIEKDLKQSFRIVRFLGIDNASGKPLNVYRCYTGSSKFTKEQMQDLIETALDIAEEVGVEDEYWRALLNQ